LLQCNINLSLCIFVTLFCTTMYLIAIAWLYVAVMMAVVEATSTTGSVLGAIVTFTLYGLLPVAILMYLLGSPMRRKKARAREQAEFEAARDSAAVSPRVEDDKP
jgi:membrane protein implicated in regulation of membrane protease activity